MADRHTGRGGPVPRTDQQGRVPGTRPPPERPANPVHRVLRLQALAGNQAVAQMLSDAPTVQRNGGNGEGSDFDDAAYGGVITGLHNVPAKLEGRALKVYVVARWGKLSQEQAAELVDRTGVPSGGIDRRQGGTVVFGLTPAEEAMIMRLRRGRESESGTTEPTATPATAEGAATPKTTSGEGSGRSAAADAAITATDVGTDFAPVVSNVKDALTAMTGINPVTGEKVGTLGRIAAGIFAIPVVGNVLKWIGKGGKALLKLGRWLVKRGGGWLRRLRKRMRSLIGAKKLKGAQAAQARAAFTVVESKLQKKFKHAADFGVAGGWSKANGAQFKAALEKHVGDTANDVISGTYHNVKATIHVNPTTGLAVIQDAQGAFVSGWKLSADQFRNLYAHGNL